MYAVHYICTAAQTVLNIFKLTHLFPHKLLGQVAKLLNSLGKRSSMHKLPEALSGVLLVELLGGAGNAVDRVVVATVEAPLESGSSETEQESTTEGLGDAALAETLQAGAQNSTSEGTTSGTVERGLALAHVGRDGVTEAVGTANQGKHRGSADMAAQSTSNCSAGAKRVAHQHQVESEERTNATCLTGVKDSVSLGELSDLAAASTVQRGESRVVSHASQ